MPSEGQLLTRESLIFAFIRKQGSIFPESVGIFNFQFLQSLLPDLLIFLHILTFLATLSSQISAWHEYIAAGFALFMLLYILTDLSGETAVGKGKK